MGREPKDRRLVLVPASLACAMVSLAAFSWLAEEVFKGQMNGFDDSVRGFVHQYSSPQFTAAMQGITFLGSPFLLYSLFAVAIIVFLALKWWRAATWLAIGVVGSAILDVTLKLLFHRSRPEPFFSTMPKSYSFPSGHALSSFCFYGILAGLFDTRIRSRLVRLSVWAAAALLVLAIGFSRIYLGVHYPTDVVAGYCAAAVWVSSLVYLDPMRQSHTFPKTSGEPRHTA